MLLQYIEDYLNHLRVERNASNITLVSYKTDLLQFTEFLSRQESIQAEYISEKMINHKSVREYLTHLQINGLNRSTMARKLASLRSFVKYLCREDILDNNPIATVATPKREKKLPRFLYDNEMTVLLEAPDLSSWNGCRDKAILEVLYASGVRVSELVSLNLQNVDTRNAFIKVTGKGNKERIVPLGDKACEALNEYISGPRINLLKKNNKAERAVFLNRFGDRLSARSIRNIVNQYVDQIALNQKVSPHVFRHTFATHLLNGGADLRSVQELLGHVKLSTTQIYTHVTSERLKAIHFETHPRR
ncbi:MAG: tyrosine recombinase XerC [Chitinophagales bacterium]